MRIKVTLVKTLKLGHNDQRAFKKCSKNKNYSKILNKLSETKMRSLQYKVYRGGILFILKRFKTATKKIIPHNISEQIEHQKNCQTINYIKCDANVYFIEFWVFPLNINMKYETICLRYSLYFVETMTYNRGTGLFCVIIALLDLTHTTHHRL